jgi:hypothetical protein
MYQRAVSSTDREETLVFHCWQKSAEKSRQKKKKNKFVVGGFRFGKLANIYNLLYAEDAFLLWKWTNLIFIYRFFPI